MPPVDRSSSLVACTRILDAPEGPACLGWWLWRGQLEIIWSFTVLLPRERQQARSRSCIWIQGEHSDQVGEAGKVSDVVREGVVNIVGHHRRHDVGIVDLVAGYGMLSHQCQKPLSDCWTVLPAAV